MLLPCANLLFLVYCKEKVWNYQLDIKETRFKMSFFLSDPVEHDQMESRKITAHVLATEGGYLL